MVNRQILLASRPSREPHEENFRLVEKPLAEPRPGEFVLRTIYLSVDPYMRGRMRDERTHSDPAAIGDVMPGNVVGEIVRSSNPLFREGEIVEGRIGWQEYAVSDGSDVRKIDRAWGPISTAVGILGMPGMTAYFGMLDVGQPRTGDTVVVSAAAGAVGGLAGQIARIKGARVVGIVGSDAKRAYITETLGFDAAINYKSEDVGDALTRTCPNGIDVYFDNVGGGILDAVLARINQGARIAICGMISEYNLEDPSSVRHPTRTLLFRRARMQGFLVSDFQHRRDEGVQQISAWLRNDRIAYREDVVEGLENAPRAFMRLFSGKNFGKQLVKVSDEPT